MKKIADLICKNKWFVILTTLILLVPSLIGMLKTKVNYDILVYLPEDIETIKGQNILTNDFNMGAFSMVVVENVEAKDILKFEENARKIAGVEKCISIADITGTVVPLEILPKNLLKKVINGDSTLMLITFNSSTSSIETLNAVEEIRELAKDNFEIGGMSSMVLDTMNLSDEEVVLYVVIAVICCLIVLLLSLDSYFVPILLLANIGIAILYNMGTNIIFGEISYITKAISAVLQLGVTTDFSIFLYHKYIASKGNYKNNEEAMSHAICETVVSVFGSSLTTIAGFLALCAMSLTLGMDIGLVMAKGVIFGVLCVITVFPSLLLVFDKIITKTKHKVLLPKFTFIKNIVIKNRYITLALFLLLVIPFFYGNNHTPVYYNLDRTLPADLKSSIANSKLKEKFNIVSPEIILLDSNIKPNIVSKITDEIGNLDGIDLTLSAANIQSIGIPVELLSSETRSIFQNDKYQLILVNSTYNIATKELNNQISEISKIVKQYDKNAIVAGEGPLMKDMVEIAAVDLQNVNIWSIGLVFLIMIFVLKSISLPVLLVLAIEFAIFVNMGIPYYTGTELPFISSIVIGTIQLGATIDYAILMTTKYLDERKSGKNSIESIKIALDNSVSSIIVSGLCLFASTIGVGIISRLEMISSLCILIARGAIVSMIIVIFLIPAFLTIFDKVIIKTTSGFEKGGNMKKNIKKIASIIMIATIFGSNFMVTDASVKKETVYTSLFSDGTRKKVIVNEHLYGDEEKLKDISNLKNIMNINGDETFTKDKDTLIWNGNDIYYKGESDKPLPIDINVTYKLNGIEYKKEEMISKSGDVEIEVKLKNNDAHNVIINGKSTTLYTPFVVALGTIIPASGNSNITITNGKVISNGLSNIALSLSMPGLSESLNSQYLSDLNKVVIRYNTKSFSSFPVYLVATPKLLDKDDLKVFNRLDGLYSKVYTLDSSANKLASGSKTLKDGLSEYQTKIEELASTIDMLNNGAKALVAGYGEINNGINTLANSMDGANTLLNGISNIASGTSTLTTGVNTLTEKINGISENAQTVDKTISTHITNLQEIYETTTDMATKDLLGKELASLQQIIAQYDLNTAIKSINEINNGMNTLNSSMNQISQNIGTLQSGLKSLSGSINTLKTGSNTFNTKINEFSGYFNTLNSKMPELKDGTSALVNGSNTLYNGITEFNNKGIKVLTSGLYSVKDTVEKVNKLLSLGEEYQTFTMKDENTKGETKFVIVIE